MSDAVDHEWARRRAAEAAALEQRRTLEAEAERRRRELEARVTRDAVEPRLTTFPTVGSSEPTTIPDPSEERWPTDLAALRRLVGDADLATRLEEPLSTDVDCDVPPAVWHLMAFLEWRKRGDNPHALAVRATIVMNGCGYSLTGDAIAGVLAIARQEP